MPVDRDYDVSSPPDHECGVSPRAQVMFEVVLLVAFVAFVIGTGFVIWKTTGAPGG